VACFAHMSFFIDAGVAAIFNCHREAWNLAMSRWRFAMPQPHQFDPPSRAPLLTCPKCLGQMRIKTIDAVEDHDRIEFICDECGIEAHRDSKRPW
jgi:hypothetical protein